MAVPRTAHVHADIAKAIHALAAREADEGTRRCAEIAAIHRDLEQIPDLLREALSEYRVLLQAEFRKYSADQPRVPKGNPDGGQRTDEGSDASSGYPAVSPGHLPGNGSKSDVHYAALETDTRTDASNSAVGVQDHRVPIVDSAAPATQSVPPYAQPNSGNLRLASGVPPPVGLFATLARLLAAGRITQEEAAEIR
jgi:hypothetical protein